MFSRLTMRALKIRLSDVAVRVLPSFFLISEMGCAENQIGPVLSPGSSLSHRQLVDLHKGCFHFSSALHTKRNMQKLVSCLILKGGFDPVFCSNVTQLHEPTQDEEQIQQQHVQLTYFELSGNKECAFYQLFTIMQLRIQ